MMPDATKRRKRTQIPAELTNALAELVNRFGSRKFATAVNRLKWERGTIRHHLSNRRRRGRPSIDKQVAAIFAGRPLSTFEEQFLVKCCGLQCLVRLHRPTDEAVTFLALHRAHKFAWEPVDATAEVEDA